MAVRTALHTWIDYILNNWLDLAYNGVHTWPMTLPEAMPTEHQSRVIAAKVFTFIDRDGFVMMTRRVRLNS